MVIGILYCIVWDIVLEVILILVASGMGKLSTCVYITRIILRHVYKLIVSSDEGVLTRELYIKVVAIKVTRLSTDIYIYISVKSVVGTSMIFKLE